MNGTNWRELVLGRRETAGRRVVAVVATFVATSTALAAANAEFASGVPYSGTAYWLGSLLVTVGGAAANGYRNGGLLVSWGFASAGVSPFLLVLMLDGGTTDLPLTVGVVEVSKYALPYAIAIGSLAFAVGWVVRGYKQ